VETYLLGVVAAFVIGLIKLVVAVSELLSTAARNFKTVGRYYQLWTGCYFAEKPPTPAVLVTFAVWMLVVAPLGSWLSVASAVWTYSKFLKVRSAQPPPLKAALYRVRNERLTRDEMVALQEELAKEQGLTGRALTGDNGDADPTLLVLEETEKHYFVVEVNPNEKTLEFRDIWDGCRATG
jgi:hypothetical protein